jgi:hypothetical protein
LFDA